jgi:hypothetical protein
MTHLDIMFTSVVASAPFAIEHDDFVRYDILIVVTVKIAKIATSCDVT